MPSPLTEPTAPPDPATGPDPVAAQLAQHPHLGPAVAVLDAVLSAADVQLIGVSNWWTRAESALAASLNRGTVLEMAGVMARKLQCDVLTPTVTAAVVDAAARVDDFGAFRTWVGRNAELVVAITRLTRRTRKTTTTVPAAAAPAAADTLEF